MFLHCERSFVVLATSTTTPLALSMFWCCLAKFCVVCLVLLFLTWYLWWLLLQTGSILFNRWWRWWYVLMWTLTGQTARATIQLLEMAVGEHVGGQESCQQWMESGVCATNTLVIFWQCSFTTLVMNALVTSSSCYGALEIVWPLLLLLLLLFLS